MWEDGDHRGTRGTGNPGGTCTRRGGLGGRRVVRDVGAGPEGVPRVARWGAGDGCEFCAELANGFAGGGVRGGRGGEQYAPEAYVPHGDRDFKVCGD